MFGDVRVSGCLWCAGGRWVTVIARSWERGFGRMGRCEWLREGEVRFVTELRCEVSVGGAMRMGESRREWLG